MVLIDQKYQAFHNCQKKKIADDLNISLHCEIKCDTLFEKATRLFLNNKIKDHKKYLSDIWRTIKSLGTSFELKSGSTSIGLDVDGSTTFDKIKVADTFNKFFTTVAKKLV